MVTLDQLLQASREERAKENESFPELQDRFTENPRTEARVLSVQAVYDHLLTDVSLFEILEDF